jgi:hypothetical protein
MSTTTNFKRIALVAVAALGLGVLSSVPTNAAVTGALTVTTTNGTGATLLNSDSTTAATVAVRYFQSNNADTASVVVTMGLKPATATHATADILVTALDTSLSTGATGPTLKGKGAVATAWSTPFGTDSITATTGTGVITPTASGNAYGKFGFFLDSSVARVAGTYTLDYQVRVFPGGTEDATKAQSGSVTITVTDATQAAAGAVSASGTSTALMKSGSSYSTVTVDDVVTAVNTPSTSSAVAVIQVTQKTAAGLPSRESITVTTNIGNVGTSGSATGKTVTFVGEANGINQIGVFADGTSGVATISIKTTSVTFASKQITFYSTTVAKIVASPVQLVLGGTSVNAIAAKAYDSLNNQIVDNTSVYAYSSDLNVVNTGATTGTACSYVADVAAQVCQLAGAANGKADITLRDKSTAALSTVASNVVAVSVNTNAAASIKIAFDKATYAPGEAAYVRIWAVDAAGAVVGTNSQTSLLATGGITSTVAFGNGSASTESLTATTLPMNATTAASNGYASTDPIYMVKVFMPSAGGTVSVSATGGTALPAVNQVKVTATATVTDSGAAALAAVTALATTVASLRTLIVTLTNLVLKIQKKVRA